jgi:hypothetical protein
MMSRKRTFDGQIKSKDDQVFVPFKTRIPAGHCKFKVNVPERFEKQDFENPTIGILLCTDKNDAVVKITLPENNNTIIASKYQLYLPTEQQLIEEVKKEIEKRDKDED